MKRIFLFSDEISLGNPGYGGYCAILKCQENERCNSTTKGKKLKGVT